MQNLAVGTEKNEQQPRCWMNQVSPYSVNPSREFHFPTNLEKFFHRIPVNLGPRLKTLAVMQDEANVSR